MARGGTGVVTFTSNGVLLGAGAGNVVATTAGTADQVFVVPHAGGTPVFGQVNLAQSAAITGTLPVVNGGTGVISYTNGQLLIGNTTGNTIAAATLTAGANIAITNGASSITIDLTGTVPVANGGTGLSSSPITVALGGTGRTTLTAHGVIVGNGTTGVTQLAVGTTNQVLIGNSAADPSWGTVNVATGGTGAATFTANGVLLGNTTSAIQVTAAGTADQTLVIPHVGGAPVFGQLDISQAAAIKNTLPIGNGGTGQTAYTDGQLLIGNTATGLLSKATLTQGTGITITNGNGTITIANSSTSVSSIADATNGGLSFSASTGAVTAKLLPSDFLTKASPTTSDSLILMDAAASNAAKTATIPQIITGQEPSKATLQTGTDNTTAVTPRRVNDHDGTAKAWTYFTLTAGGATNTVSENVGSITRNSAGNYTINFTTAFATANYAVAFSLEDDGSNLNRRLFISAGGRASGSCTIIHTDNVGSPSDTGAVGMVFFGRQ